MTRTKLRSLLGIGLLAMFVAGQASAVNIETQTSGNEVVVSATGLAGDIIAAWDMDIYFSTALSVVTVTPGGELGDFNFFESDFGYGSVGGSGFLDAFEVSYLSDAELLGLQDGNNVVLFTIEFSGDAANAGIRFVWDDFNDVKCAENRVCYPPQVPEPGTLALLGLGLTGLALGRRRRS